MLYRAEILLLDSDESGTTLGRFETATEARTACVQHEGDALSWLQPIEDMWEAQGVERWYRVLLSP